jgi:3-oxoacyl-[acyl-carrier protein] reductase
MLAGKTALIIGATSDLGHSISLKFADFGVSTFILHGRDLSHLTSLAAILQSRNLSVISLPCDLLSPSEFSTFVSELRRILIFPLDIFVYAPGICGEMDPIGFLRMDTDFQTVFRVNFTACVALFDLCAVHFSSKASAILITSTNSVGPIECGSAYCTTKSALREFMRRKAVELGGRGVRVNAVAPGFVATKMHDGYFESKEELEAFYVEKAKKTALGRMASAEGVAKTVAFLGSELARDMTGVEIVVDCGASLSWGGSD